MVRPIRPLALTAFVVGFALLVAHASVLAAWQFAVLPDLARSPRADLLSAARAAELPPPPCEEGEPLCGSSPAVEASAAQRPKRGEWSVFDVAGIRMLIPAAGTARSLNPACAVGCTLPLAEGVLRVGARARSESYWQTVLLLAPDRRDVSWLYPPWHNWSAMLALSRRVLVVHSRSWRFESAASRGVVTTYANRGVLRHVVYAHSLSGDGTRPLLFSRVRTDVLLGVLASLDVLPSADGS